MVVEVLKEIAEASDYFVILFICILCQVIRSDKSLKNAWWTKEEYTNFSGGAIIDHHWWFVLITGTFFHADWAHLINNMLMFLPFAPMLEHFVGRFAMFGLFVLCGIFGWTASFCYQVYKYGEMSKFNMSCGSSGATYGMNSLLCMLHCVIGVADFWFPPWVWVSLVWFAPLLFSSRKPFGPWSRKYWPLVVMLAYSTKFIVPDKITMAYWTVQYQFKCIFFSLATNWWKGKLPEYPTTDNACHLGGFVGGFIASFWFRSYHSCTNVECTPFFVMVFFFLTLLFRVLIYL